MIWDFLSMTNSFQAAWIAFGHREGVSAGYPPDEDMESVQVHRGRFAK
jgi:hypothetical protein